MINHVDERMQAILGDCRKKHPNAVADRVIMGYLPGTIDYLPSALETLSHKGGIIHMHDSLPKTEIAKHCNTINTLALRGGFTTDIQVRKIKHYSPGVTHFVFDILLQPFDTSKA